MGESRFRCEAEDEFNRRYYHWALEDAEREVTQAVLTQMYKAITLVLCDR